MLGKRRGRGDAASASVCGRMPAARLDPCDDRRRGPPSRGQADRDRAAPTRRPNWRRCSRWMMSRSRSTSACACGELRSSSATCAASSRTRPMQRHRRQQAARRDRCSRADLIPTRSIVPTEHHVDRRVESVAAIQPATAGRHRCSGARQSTPSISNDNCAEVSDSVSPGSTLGGHRKTPCSSRLVNRQSPVPSQNTILMRLAWCGRGTRTGGPRTDPAAARPAPAWRGRRCLCACRCSRTPDAPSRRRKQRRHDTLPGVGVARVMHHHR